MLKKLLLWLVFALPVFSFSQTPVPFPDQDATWLYREYDDFGGFIGYHSFFLDGDSSYLGRSWARLKVSFNANPIGLIRQDSSLKVWYIPQDSTVPEYLYDFGAVPGDTLYGLRTSFVTPLDTMIVDTVLPAGGQFNRRSWHMSSISQRAFGMWYTWFEGIGDNAWLPASVPVTLVSGSTILECFTDQFFTNPGNPCIVATEAPQSAALVEVSPIPASERLSIRNLNAGQRITSAIVFNQQGQKIREISLKSLQNGTSEIELSEFQNGIYFLRIEGEKASETVKFVVVH